MTHDGVEVGGSGNLRRAGSVVDQRRKRKGPGRCPGPVRNWCSNDQFFATTAGVQKMSQPWVLKLRRRRAMSPRAVTKKSDGLTAVQAAFKQVACTSLRSKWMYSAPRMTSTKLPLWIMYSMPPPAYQPVFQLSPLMKPPGTPQMPVLALQYEPLREAPA